MRETQIPGLPRRGGRGLNRACVMECLPHLTNSAAEARRREVASNVARQGRVDLTRQDSRFRTSCGQSQSQGPVAHSRLDALPAIGFRNRSDHLRDEEPLRRHNAAGLSVFYQAGPEEVQVRCFSRPGHDRRTHHRAWLRNQTAGGRAEGGGLD